MKTSEIVRVTKKFSFDMAHALEGYDGPCKNIHGHTYHLTVTILGRVVCEEGHPKNGMVMDFTDFKKMVNEQVIRLFDHALVLAKRSPLAEMTAFNEQYSNVIYAEYQPSCENLLIDFKDRIRRHLPEPLVLHSIRLDETPTSYAEWFREDNL